MATIYLRTQHTRCVVYLLTLLSYKKRKEGLEASSKLEDIYENVNTNKMKINVEKAKTTAENLEILFCLHFI